MRPQLNAVGVGLTIEFLSRNSHALFLPVHTFESYEGERNEIIRGITSVSPVSLMNGNRWTPASLAACSDYFIPAEVGQDSIL